MRVIHVKDIYIVKLIMSSQNKIDHTERIDEFTQETTFKWDGETRQAIGAARMSIRTAVYAGSVDFVTLRIVDGDQLPRIMRAVEEGKVKLKEIADTYRCPEKTCMWKGMDPVPSVVPGYSSCPKCGARVKAPPPALSAQLKVDVVPTKLDREEMNRGEIRRRIIDSIMYQVYKEIADRIARVMEHNEALPAQSKKGILDALKKMEVMNVLDDPEVDEKIAAIRAQVEADVIQPLRAQLDKDLRLLTSRWAYLEFKDEEKAPRPKRPKKTEQEAGQAEA